MKTYKCTVCGDEQEVKEESEYVHRDFVRLDIRDDIPKPIPIPKHQHKLERVWQAMNTHIWIKNVIEG